jgi:mono/diheme cytochrome c family protein
MEQIKYILYSVLIMVGAALTFTAMKPLVQSQWVADSGKAATAGEATAKPVVVKNIEGKSLFTANCATCHGIQRNLTGPALAGVEERGPWTKRENLVKWVHNPATFIAADPYAKELAAQYNGQVMPSFPQLSEADINQIFDYVKEASAQ